MPAWSVMTLITLWLLIAIVAEWWAWECELHDPEDSQDEWPRKYKGNRR